MNFFMMIIFIFEAVVGIGSSVFILISLFWVIGKKIIRKCRYKTSLYD